MREWPSIVPAASEDLYTVVNHYGRFGTAFAETGLGRANYETTIADLMSGQHCDPLRVVTFNPDTNRSEDVSRAIAHANDGAWHFTQDGHTSSRRSGLRLSFSVSL